VISLNGSLRSSRSTTSTSHEPSHEAMRLWLLVTATPSTISPGLELLIDESPRGLVWKIPTAFDCERRDTGVPLYEP
jgi:hypothetical protein